MVVLLGAMVLLPLGVRAQPYQVTGLVRICPTSGFVPTATVTLTDVNGINPPRTATTDLGGVYRFDQPPTGSYSVTANRSGYFSSAPSNPVRFDGSQTVQVDVCMVPHGTPPKVLAVTVENNGGSPVSGATVSAYSSVTGRIQLVTTGTTNTAGVTNLTLWPAVFSVRASAPGLQTVEVSVDVAAVSSTTISLVATVELFGHVKDLDTGNFLNTGVVAWLYNPAAANTSSFRLIPATVKDSLFEFEDIRVSNAIYTIIVDAKGYLAHTDTVTTTGTPTEYNVDLKAAPDERYDTTILYGAQDWNNLTVWRNLTLNADSTLAGLGPANLRDLRLQIDSTFGNGNGAVTVAERAAFNASLAARGPAYVTTDALLKTNGKAYLSSPANYTFTVQGLETPASPVWINTTTTYAVKQAPPFIVYGSKTYFVNVTMVPDSNITTLFNFTYTIALPRRYERNTTSITGPVIATDFTRVILDPGVPSSSNCCWANMTVSQSINGTARAKVVAPAGKFHAANATPTNYQAYVAKDTELTFSAADSLDPNGPAENANYTWKFTPNPGDIRYGIQPKFKYLANGTFIVNITMREAGGNFSYREITLFVDDQLPTARIRTNRTGTGSANGLILRVDSGIPVRFDGGLSSDFAYPGKTGVILPDTGYAWDFGEDATRDTDSTGRNVTHTFDKPGNFTVNLTVTDSVGWKGANATMTAMVNDTKAPVPGFDILDPEREWGTIASPVELKTIAFNASKTTDDYDKVGTMNFTWTIPGPIVGLGAGNHTFYGVNVTFAWGEWNNSYRVVLSARDTGFRGDDAGAGAPKPNTGNLSRNITVQIDSTLHADLRVDAGTLKVVPTDPEEGADVRITVNVTNKPNRATASAVTTQLAIITGGVVTILQPTVKWFKGGAETQDRTIASGSTGSTVTIEFTVRLSGQGNKTLRVYVFDASEPYTWQTSENKAQSPVNVRQPWWQPYAIAGSVIGVIVLFVFGMYARRKIKAGEWRPIRGRRGEKGAEEKPRKEVREEKKRL
jgi:PKD repeat protein